MNNSIELPSGKIINIARFIALIPNNNIDSDYQLILEGYPHHIKLETSDAQHLKTILQSKQNTITTTHQSTWNQQEQIQKNQKAMAVLAQRISQHKNMSEEESLQQQEFFEEFKKTVDSQRPVGQKLYS
ncbi:MAG: hypothetical protein EAZ87_15425 [Nostocales cyanobacterium]|nr:MAG: hypothetical protein EAZ87_15425 [Nostocales cyanobacterium]